MSQYVPPDEIDDSPSTATELQECLGTGLRGFVSTPFTNVATLIQLGYEPKGEWPSTNLFGMNGFRRLGLFSYGKFIYENHGLAGLYRGAVCRGFESFISAVTRDKARKVVWGDYTPKALAQQEYTEAVSNYVKEVMLDSMCGCAAVVLSHPFYVVGTRMAGQLVGGENVYSGLVEGFRVIIDEDGIAGLFRGVLPACYGEVVYVASMTLLMKTFTWLFDQFAKRPEEGIEKLAMHVVAVTIATPFFYPFKIGKAIMSVNDSGLACSKLQIQPRYDSWVEALREVYDQGGWKPRGLLRGSSNFRRFHWTPQEPNHPKLA